MPLLYGNRLKRFCKRGRLLVIFSFTEQNGTAIIRLWVSPFSATAWWTDWPSDSLGGIDCYRPSEYVTVVLGIFLLVFTGKEGFGYVDFW